VAGLDSALSVYGGKEVVNVVVAAAPDKGKALLSLVDRGGFDSAFFAGDDVNDESVFERAPPGWVTARVGHVPDSRARFGLESIDEMPQVIDAMIERLARSGQRHD
jgi:trehalose 6-phosphate phosphatase